MIKRILNCLFYVLLVVLLSGCWDVISVEQRGFIIGMAIDLAEEGTTEESTTGGTTDEEYRLTVTHQFASPPGLSNPSQGGGGGGEPYMNLSVSGNSIYAIAQELNNQTNLIPFFEHLKVVIVSEEVAAIPQLFANVMDVFIRNRDTHRGVNIIIAKGKAKDILDIQSENEMLPVRYIDDILENSLKETDAIRTVKLGDIHEHLIANSSFVLSEMAAKDTTVSFEGGAVLNGSSEQKIASLEKVDMRALNLITGENVRGPIEVNYKGDMTVYSVRESNSKIKINAKNPEKIEIDVTIKLEGEMQETFGAVLLDDPGETKGLEEEVSAKVEEITKQTIEKAQKDLETDIFGFLHYLKQSNYDTWKKVKEDWDDGENFFANSTVNVSVEAKIRADGVVEKSTNEGN